MEIFSNFGLSQCGIINFTVTIVIFFFYKNSHSLHFSIFTAFVLEAFILEFTLETVPKLETVIETKIKEFGLGIGM